MDKIFRGIWKHFTLSFVVHGVHPTDHGAAIVVEGGKAL